MSENTAQKDIDLSKMVYPLIVDEPVYLTVEGAAQELIVKAFMPVTSENKLAPISAPNSAGSRW